MTTVVPPEFQGLSQEECEAVERNVVGIASFDFDDIEATDVESGYGVGSAQISYAMWLLEERLKALNTQIDDEPVEAEVAATQKQIVTTRHSQQMYTKMLELRKSRPLEKPAEKTLTLDIFFKKATAKATERISSQVALAQKPTAVAQKPVETEEAAPEQPKSKKGKVKKGKGGKQNLFGGKKPTKAVAPKEPAINKPPVAQPAAAAVINPAAANASPANSVTPTILASPPPSGVPAASAPKPPPQLNSPHVSDDEDDEEEEPEEPGMQDEEETAVKKQQQVSKVVINKPVTRERKADASEWCPFYTSAWKVVIENMDSHPERRFNSKIWFPLFAEMRRDESVPLGSELMWRPDESQKNFVLKPGMLVSTWATGNDVLGVVALMVTQSHGSRGATKLVLVLKPSQLQMVDENVRLPPNQRKAPRGLTMMEATPDADGLVRVRFELVTVIWNLKPFAMAEDQELSKNAKEYAERTVRGRKVRDSDRKKRGHRSNESTNLNTSESHQPEMIASEDDNEQRPQTHKPPPPVSVNQQGILMQTNKEQPASKVQKTGDVQEMVTPGAAGDQPSFSSGCTQVMMYNPRKNAGVSGSSAMMRAWDDGVRGGDLSKTVVQNNQEMMQVMLTTTKEMATANRTFQETVMGLQKQSIEAAERAQAAQVAANEKMFSMFTDTLKQMQAQHATQLAEKDKQAIDERKTLYSLMFNKK